MWGSLTVTLQLLCYGCKTHITLLEWGSLTVMLKVWGLQFHYVCKSFTFTLSCEAHLQLHYWCEVHSFLHYKYEAHSRLCCECETHNHATGVRLTQIYTKSVRLIHSYNTCVSLSIIYIMSVRLITLELQPWGSLIMSYHIWVTIMRHTHINFIFEIPSWASLTGMLCV